MSFLEGQLTTKQALGIIWGAFLLMSVGTLFSDQNWNRLFFASFVPVVYTIVLILALAFNREKE